MTFTLLVTVAIGVSASAGAPQPAETSSSERAAQLKQAREHLTSGDIVKALDIADRLLEGSPTDIDAIRIKASALVEVDKTEEALQTYDAYVTAGGTEDREALTTVGRGVLNTLTSASNVQIRTQALETLAQSRSLEARRGLEAAAKADPPTPVSWAATIALARLGDREAASRVATQARDAVGGIRLAALRALRTIETEEAEAAVRAALTSPDPVLQAAAAEVAGERQLSGVRPELTRVLQESRFGAPLQAAVALKRMGDSAGDALLAVSLASELPDARLIAARAFRDGKEQSWIERVRPLLTSENALTPVAAAEALLHVDRQAALPVLTKALTDANPVVRGEAMRVVADDHATELSLLRRGLADASPIVQLAAARALIVLTPP